VIGGKNLSAFVESKRGGISTHELGFVLRVRKKLEWKEGSLVSSSVAAGYKKYLAPSCFADRRGQV
jgi:hypothetical protein